MDIEIVSHLRGAKRAKWIEFLSRAGLEADEGVQRTVLIWDGDDLIATGGTIKAAAELVEELGGEVVKILFLLELKGLEGRKLLEGYDVETVVA